MEASPHSVHPRQLREPQRSTPLYCTPRSNGYFCSRCMRAAQPWAACRLMPLAKPSGLAPGGCRSDGDTPAWHFSMLARILPLQCFCQHVQSGGFMRGIRCRFIVVQPRLASLAAGQRAKYRGRRRCSRCHGLLTCAARAGAGDPPKVKIECCRSCLMHGAVHQLLHTLWHHIEL